MRLFIIYFFCLCFGISYAQEDIVAKEYFKSGDFEKALVSYKKLYAKNSRNRNYLIQLVKTEQQLELYKDAETRLLEALAKRETENKVMLKKCFSAI